MIRVESPSPERAGAEHCLSGARSCRPLAARQKLPGKGVVRTFAGGKVSLDFANGRRVDLGSLSEVSLEHQVVRFKRGDFSVETSPLIGKEEIPPWQINAGGRQLRFSSQTVGSAALSVGEEDTVITMRRGVLLGLKEHEGRVLRSGRSIRLASAKVFRTGRTGFELPQLPLQAPSSDALGGLLAKEIKPHPRGLGAMSARLPNSDQIRDGVILKRHHVNVVIRDGFARTEVEEEFENTTGLILEGRYRFPVPGDASLSRLALWVGEELVEGEILERKRAAGIYASIVDRPIPRDPALLEWVTGGTMSLKVFPILPKKTRRVLLAYNQALSSEGGILRYIYPLSLGEGRQTSIGDLSITVHLSDSQAQLRELRVPGYEVDIGREGSFHTLRFSGKKVAPQKDFVVLVNRDVPARAQLSAYRPEEDSSPDQKNPSLLPNERAGLFALRLSAKLPEGMELPEFQATDRAIILDISQSQSQQTLRAQTALAYGIIREMEPGEEFWLLACDSACEVYRSTKARNNDTRGRLQQARDWLVALTPGGSSDVAGALVAATQALSGARKGRGRSRQVVYIGDGRASSGELSAATIAERVEGILGDEQVDLRMIAAGRSVDEDLLRVLALRLGATLDLLQSGIALEARISEIAIGLRQPVLRHARLSVPNSLRLEVAQYESENLEPNTVALPALRLGQEVILSGEILKREAGQLRLQGTLGGQSYTLNLPIHWSPDSASQNPLIPHLWARDSIRRMQGEEPTRDVVRRIVELSKKYRTMSRHTSFLVLENEKMYRDFGVKRSTRSPQDQPESGFSDLRGKEWRDGKATTSFEELSSFEELESESVPAAPSLSSSRGTASAAKRSRSRPKKKSAALPRKDAARPRPRPRPRPRLRHRRHTRRAHLRHRTDNDEWRSWGVKVLKELSQKLQEYPQSRLSYEAFIRGHLSQGRFQEAERKAAEFVKLDPDFAGARPLLAYAAVASGDHELARLMLDVQTESAPRDAQAHAEAARSFEVVGDIVRACAHYRSLKELAPALVDAAARVLTCWQDVLKDTDRQTSQALEGKLGQLEIEVECDEEIREQDCPSPLAVAPDGRILSPWTPGVGRSSRSRISFVKLRSGVYRIMVLGGSPSSRGILRLVGRYESTNFRFEGGALHSVAKTDVVFR